MKTTHTAVEAKKNPKPAQASRSKQFAPPVAGAEKLALGRAPQNAPWQAHGRIRSVHQAAAMHLSRKRAG